MFIKVDLPAPFSPTMPWIDPAGTTRSISRLAWTAPKRLSIPRSSTAGGTTPGSGATVPGGAIGPAALSLLLLGRVVVLDLELAVDDRLLGLVDLGLDLGPQHLAVVLVHRVADPLLLQPERLDAGLPGAVPGAREGVVDSDADALEDGK